MTNMTTKLGHAGLDALRERPLLTSIWHRRTHRVSRGSSIEAGSMSWTSSEPRTPLTELEEAVLISLTGCTGLTMPDRPFSDPRDHKPIMAKPNLNMAGRTAGKQLEHPLHLPGRVRRSHYRLDQPRPNHRRRPMA